MLVECSILAGLSSALPWFLFPDWPTRGFSVLLSREPSKSSSRRRRLLSCGISWTGTALKVRVFCASRIGKLNPTRFVNDASFTIQPLKRLRTDDIDEVYLMKFVRHFVAARTVVTSWLGWSYDTAMLCTFSYGFCAASPLSILAHIAVIVFTIFICRAFRIGAAIISQACGAFRSRELDLVRQRFAVDYPSIELFKSWQARWGVSWFYSNGRWRGVF